MAEWWEPVVGVSLVIATVGLVCATIYLGKQTKATVELTKASIKASEALQILPSLFFNTAQPLSDGGGKYARFSVKNDGYGSAKNLQIKVTRNGQDLPVKPHTRTNTIEVDNLFYWDISDVRVGDTVDIEIRFTDIRGVEYPPLHHSYLII